MSNLIELAVYAIATPQLTNPLLHILKKEKIATKAIIVLANLDDPVELLYTPVNRHILEKDI